MKNVVISGTSRGIGFELAKLFAHHNFNVLALSRNSKPLEALNHTNITVMAIDLTEEESMARVQKFVKNNWTQVDLLINNAGTLLNKPFARTSTQDFIDVYRVNVFAVAALTQALLPYFVKNTHTVTISSMGGIQGSIKFPGLAAYSSSKGAVITLSELLAEEYREKGFIFNVLAIGAVQTEMLAEAFPDYQAPVLPNEMAAYIYNFATTAYKFYNGQVLQVSTTTP